MHLFYFSRSVLFAPVGLDELYHHFWAMDIASGHIAADGVFFRAPFYPYLLGFVYWISSGSLLWARALGLVSGLVSIYLSWLIAKEFSDKRLVPGLTALIFAVNPVFIYFESRLLLDFLLLPFMELLILFIIRVERKKLYSFLAGISAGLFAITRPTILALLPFITGYLLWQHKKKLGLVLFCVGVSLPILPVFLSNLSNNSSNLVASQGGINFYIGNNEKADGVSASFPGLGNAWHNSDAVRLIKKQNPDILDSDISGFFYRQGMKFLFSWSGIKLLTKKTGLFLHGVFIGNNGDIDFYRRFSPVLRIPNPSGVIFALGLLGFIFVRKKGMGFLALIFIIYSTVIILFFVNTRFKLPVFPSLIISSALFVKFTLEQKRKKKVFLFIAAGLLSLLLSYDLFGFSEFNSGDFQFSLGLAEMRKGDYDSASRHFENSLEVNPTKRSAHLNLGIIALKSGRMEKAIEFFTDEVKSNGDRAKALSNIGLVYRLKEEYNDAVRYGRMALSEDGDLRDAYYNLSQSYIEIDRADSAYITARDGLSEYPDNLRLLYATATALLLENSDSSYYYYRKVIENGNRDLVQNYDFGTRIQADMGLSINDRELVAKAHFNLARPGIPLDSIEYHLKRAIELSPSFQKAYIQLGNIMNMRGKSQQALTQYRKALETGPLTPLLAFNLGNSEAATGNYQRAEQLFQIAAADSSLYQEAEKRLKAIEKITR